MKPPPVEVVHAGVQMVVTLALVGAFVWGFAADKIDAAVFVGVAGPILGIWFKGIATNGTPKPPTPPTP